MSVSLKSNIYQIYILLKTPFFYKISKKLYNIFQGSYLQGLCLLTIQDANLKMYKFVLAVVLLKKTKRFEEKITILDIFYATFKSGHVFLIHLYNL